MILTCVVGCGSPTGPAGLTTAPTTEKPPKHVDKPAIDAGVPDVPPPPKLACDPGTTPTPADKLEPTWACVRDDGTRDGPFITLFPDQTIQISGAYKAGKLAGAWQRNYPGGAIAETGQYADGLATGHWKQLAPTGAVLGEYDLNAGTGLEKRWYDSGPLYSERPLQAGVLHGTAKIYAPDTTLLASARYFHGKLDGAHNAGTRNTFRIEETFSGGTRTGKRTIWQFWALVFEEQYDFHGRFDGPYVVWRDKKVARFKGDYEHGKKVGPWVWNDRANNKEREGSYVAGKRDGVWNEWFENKLTFTGTYVTGKPDGTFIYSDRNANELGRFDIKDGTGTMLTFYGNRKVATKEHVVKGAHDGVYQELTLRGKVEVEGHYSSDLKWGNWKEWTPDGVLLLDETYRRGRLEGAVKKLIDGKPSLQATYKDGKAEGPYTEMRDGKPAVTGQFANDLRTGTWTYYDPAGSVTLVATYDKNVVSGPWRQLVGGVVIEGTMTNGRRTGTWTRTDKAGAVVTTTYKAP